MRSELPSLVGRDHLSFRSYYQPVRNVTDGDLCELYNSLDISKKKSIAEELDRTPNEVGLGGWCYHVHVDSHVAWVGGGGEGGGG